MGSRLHIQNIIKHPMSYVLCCCIKYAQSIIAYANNKNRCTHDKCLFSVSVPLFGASCD